jgi:hypothetical protein
VSGVVAKTSFSEFMERVRTRHGDKFDVNEEEYSGTIAPVTVFCNVHDQVIPLKFANLLYNGNPCDNCRRDAKLANYVAAVQTALSSHYPQFRPLFDAIHDFNIEVTLECPKHGAIQANTDAIKFARFGCAKCGRDTTGSKLRGTNRVSFKTFARRFKKRFGQKLTLTSKESEYVNFQSVVTAQCNQPDHPQTPKKAINWLKSNGCTACNESQGERLTRLALEELGICFEQEKRFASCRDRKELPFDFWLPDHATLIEFQGAQHAEAAERFGGVDALHGTKRRDAIKENWAKENNLPLIKLYKFSGIKSEILRALEPNGDFDPKSVLRDIEEKEAHVVAEKWGAYLNKLKGKHPNLDFSVSIWRPGVKKIAYRCPNHGLRDGHLLSLLRGHGCALCAGNVVEFEEFKRRSIEKFGNKFDFSLSKFLGMSVALEFVCATHGNISLTPERHLNLVRGCRDCSPKVRDRSPQKFLQEAVEQFGDRFDYSNLGYVAADQPVTIRCREHQTVFSTLPRDHTRNDTGCCPECVALNKSKTHGKTITLEGKEYRSIKMAADAYGLKSATVRKRLKDGWNVDIAFKTPPVPDGAHMSIKTVVGDLTFSSFSDAAKHFEISEAAVRGRLNQNWSVYDAFTRPIRSTKKSDRK